MEKRKLKRLSLSQLNERTLSFESDVLRTVIGGGNGSQGNPFSWEEVDSMMDNGTWEGGYVDNGGTPYYLGGSTGATIYGNYGGSGNNPYSPIFQALAFDFIGNVCPPAGYWISFMQAVDDIADFKKGNISITEFFNKILINGMGTAIPKIGNTVMAVFTMMANKTAEIWLLWERELRMNMLSVDPWGEY